jgi:hypothetical protein
MRGPESPSVRNTPAKRVTAEISLPTPLYKSAAEGTTWSVAAEQVPLGWFDGVTAPGYRLVWEDGSLLLIAIGELTPERDLVKGIRGRLEWIAKNPGIVQDRVRAVLGKHADTRDVGIRVVVAAQSQFLSDALGTLGQRVEVRRLMFYHDDDGALRHSSTPSRISGKPRRKSAIARPAPSKRRAGSSKAAPSTVSPYIHDLLVELRHSASEALQRRSYVDPLDWRTIPEFHLLRAYALLVVIAGRLVVTEALEAPASTRTPAPHHKEQPPSQILNTLLGVLKSFASCVADESLSQSSRKLGTAVVSFVDKAMIGHACNAEGAYLGPMWKTPVPPDIDSIVSEMAKPSTVTQRNLALANAKGPDASLVGDANCAIASTVHLAQTFDTYRQPHPQRDDDRKYQAAALVRVIAGHRVLLELLGVPTPAAILAMLGLAQDISLSKTIKAFFTDDPRDARYLACLRRRAAAVLSDSGLLSDIGKHPARIVRAAREHESLLIKAVAQLFPTEG